MRIVRERAIAGRTPGQGALYPSFPPVDRNLFSIRLANKVSNALPLVSVVIPVRNESEFIARVLKSILTQDYPSDFVEVIVADGESDDDTKCVVEQLNRDHPNIQLISNPEKVVSYALNYAIVEARGEIIIRMDAHSFYPQNYISRLVFELNRLEAGNVGGVLLTLPANEGLIATGISMAISHPLGIGDSSFRLKNDRIKEVDTVPFGCFRRTLFDEIGLFDTDLIRNQDDEFNGRIIKNGGKIYLIPDVEIKYFARKTVSSLTKMFYQYGLFKPLVNKKLGTPATLRQFVPPLFVLFLLAAVLLPFIPLVGTWAWVCCLALYISLVGGVALGLALKQRRPALVLIIPFLFPLIHLSYGWGYIKGFFIVYVLQGKPGRGDFPISR